MELVYYIYRQPTEIDAVPMEMLQDQYTLRAGAPHLTAITKH